MRSRRDPTPVVTTALILLGPLICFYYLSCEQAFYSWDLATITTWPAPPRRHSARDGGRGWRHVRASLPEDYPGPPQDFSGEVAVTHLVNGKADTRRFPWPPSGVSR